MSRRAAPPISSVSATALTISGTFQMSDLFDLPFEEDDETLEQSTGVSRQPDDGRVTTAQKTPDRSTGNSGQPDDGRLTTARKVYSVTELTVRVRDLLEEQFSGTWAEGELPNGKAWIPATLFSR